MCPAPYLSGLFGLEERNWGPDWGRRGFSQSVETVQSGDCKEKLHVGSAVSAALSQRPRIKGGGGALGWGQRGPEAETDLPLPKQQLELSRQVALPALSLPQRGGRKRRAGRGRSAGCSCRSRAEAAGFHFPAHFPFWGFSLLCTKLLEQRGQQKP